MKEDTSQEDHLANVTTVPSNGEAVDRADPPIPEVCDCVFTILRERPAYYWAVELEYDGDPSPEWIYPAFLPPGGSQHSFQLSPGDCVEIRQECTSGSQTSRIDWNIKCNGNNVGHSFSVPPNQFGSQTVSVCTGVTCTPIIIYGG